MAAHELHDGNDDGITVGGSATQKVGFFGATPVTQQVVSNSITTTATTTQIETTVLAIRSALLSLGLFTSA